MHLGQLQAGQSSVIRSLQAGDRAFRKRLIAMGLLPGTPFTVSHIAPLGDPIEIQVRGVAICLRKNEAAMLLVGEV